MLLVKRRMLVLCFGLLSKLVTIINTQVIAGSSNLHWVDALGEKVHEGAGGSRYDLKKVWL